MSGLSESDGPSGWDATLSAHRSSQEERIAQAALRLVADDGVFTAGGHRFTLEEVGAGDGLLWSIDFLPDGTMLVTQRDGVLWHFAGGERRRPGRRRRLPGLQRDSREAARPPAGAIRP